MGKCRGCEQEVRDRYFEILMRIISRTLFHVYFLAQAWA